MMIAANNLYLFVWYIEIVNLYLSRTWKLQFSNAYSYLDKDRAADTDQEIYITYFNKETRGFFFIIGLVSTIDL